MSIPRDAAVDYADIVDPDAEPVGPFHPGVILEEEFLEPLGLSAYALAKAIGVPRNRITGERAMIAETALRLARFFGMSPEFWLGLQMDYDLETHTRLDRRPAGARSDPARGLKPIGVTQIFVDRHSRWRRYCATKSQSTKST